MCLSTLSLCYYVSDKTKIFPDVLHNVMVRMESYEPGIL